MSKLEQLLERVVDKVRPRKITESKGVANIKREVAAMKEVSKRIQAEREK